MVDIKVEYSNHRCQHLGCSFGKKKVKSGGEIDLEGSQRAYNGSNHFGPNHFQFVARMNKKTRPPKKAFH